LGWDWETPNDQVMRPGGEITRFIWETQVVRFLFIAPYIPAAQSQEAALASLLPRSWWVKPRSMSL